MTLVDQALLGIALGLLLLGCCVALVVSHRAWVSARLLREKAIREMRTARRLRLLADKAHAEHAHLAQEGLKMYTQLHAVWVKLYDTPFPVDPPKHKSRDRVN